MALEPRLKYGALRIADALHRFAANKGWNPEEYRVFMTVNKDWGTYNVQIVSRAYGAWTDEVSQQAFDEVLDFFEADFQDDPELYDAVNLTLDGFEDYTWFPWSWELPQSVEQVDDALLNPGVTDFRVDWKRRHEKLREQHGL